MELILTKGYFILHHITSGKSELYHKTAPSFECWVQ